MQKKVLFSIIGVLVLGGLWYAFRPERLFINQTVHENLPPALMPRTDIPDQQPAIRYSGRFHDGAHKTQGNATVYQLPDGKRTLRLSDFETSNGPDVHVYLIAAPDAKDNATVTNAGFIDLGSIKGNKGDQNYELASNIDLSKYHAVTIWCKRFSVNFGTAPLSQQ